MVAHTPLSAQVCCTLRSEATGVIGGLVGQVVEDKGAYSGVRGLAEPAAGWGMCGPTRRAGCAPTTPATKTCSFTPKCFDRILGTPVVGWGPRTKHGAPTFEVRPHFVGRGCATRLSISPPFGNISKVTFVRKAPNVRSLIVLECIIFCDWWIRVKRIWGSQLYWTHQKRVSAPFTSLRKGRKVPLGC